MRTRPMWANTDWLEQNVLAGGGPVTECQRKTKVWQLLASLPVKESIKADSGLRRVFRAEGGTYAIWVSGTSSHYFTGVVKATAYARALEKISSDVELDSVSLPLYTSDPTTGDWDALILFRRGSK